MIGSGAQIRAARGFFGWSQADLARESGLSLNAIQYWEAGHGWPVSKRSARSYGPARIELALNRHGLKLTCLLHADLPLSNNQFTAIGRIVRAHVEDKFVLDEGCNADFLHTLGRSVVYYLGEFVRRALEPEFDDKRAIQFRTSPPYARFPLGPCRQSSSDLHLAGRQSCHHISFLEAGSHVAWSDAVVSVEYAGKRYAIPTDRKRAGYTAQVLGTAFHYSGSAFS